jgi:hypothetical protein
MQKSLLSLKGAFAMEILDLISRVRLASFVILLRKYLKNMPHSPAVIYLS